MSVNIIVAVEEVIGRWAVVTGATDGIGKAFAQELARLGCDIVLISRNQEKLDATARDVEVRFKVATKTIQADFSTLDEQMYSRIKSELEDLDVGVLVNNVGTSCEHPEYFLELEKHLGMSYQSMLNVNIASMVQMTSFVLPRMVQKHKGLIINVSSQASKMPTPLYTVYGATKSFVTKFSQDLDTECRTKGVHVHVLTTGLVTTKLSGVEKSSFISPSPQTYVKSALHEVTKKRSSDGYIGHQCVSAIAAIGTFLMPELMGNLVLKLLNYGKQFRGKNCNQCNSEKIK
ncbi:hypothetical protein GE061_015109 [Apolygus lucorum]|uniref:Estradiol 17-beta-dehydrogenase 12 n=1 Tax=Apolygus lucorum TaxID=248454 RepID=A0A8S9XK34_APOLU|nr:hypothetical protein GE061_015109 [Apolygus lucorum]